MVLDDNWYTEASDDLGLGFSLRIKSKLHEEQSAYQTIAVYETDTFGRLLTIDGLVMLTDRDNFVYHEMMTHPALFAHGAVGASAVDDDGRRGAVRRPKVFAGDHDRCCHRQVRREDAGRPRRWCRDNHREIQPGWFDAARDSGGREARRCGDASRDLVALAHQIVLAVPRGPL